MLEGHQHIVSGGDGLRVDIATAIPLFGFLLRQFKRTTMIDISQRDDRFVLPAITFIMRFSQLNTEAGETDFADQRFYLCREKPDLFITLPEVQVFAPVQTEGISCLGQIRGFATFDGVKGKLPTLYFGAGSAGMEAVLRRRATKNPSQS